MGHGRTLNPATHYTFTVVANLPTREPKMKQGIKRPIQGYLIQGLWVAMLIFWSTTNSSEIGRWVLWTGAAAGTISLTYMILRQNYFEVIDNKLIINEGVFRTTTIDLDKIEKFDIKLGPFTASKIILRDKSKIRYSDSQTNDKELREFMGQFNIPVE